MLGLRRYFQMSGSTSRFVDAGRPVAHPLSHGRCSMTSNSQAARRSVRTALRQRSRKRWAVAGGVAAAWMVLYIFTGSVLAALVILLVMTILGITCWYGLRALGVTRDHPWLVRMASRPWRDGQDVLKVAMRHMPDVFVITPSESLLAPNVVELQLNADD